MAAREAIGPVVLLFALCGCAPRGVELPGFARSPHFGEQVRTYTFEPEVTVHLNAPAPAGLDLRRPTLVVLYALPNGNTIAQTIGCAQAPGLDWHFCIQHIGAQTRRLRAVRDDVNLIVAYVEAGGRSWPAWRTRHADAADRIVALVEELRAAGPADRTTVALTAHSGGGSLLFGYLEAVERIPDWIERIVWLDANYAYSDAGPHAARLLEWLERSPRHALGVVAYDDREIELNGKKIIGPTGGTYRRTHAMVERLGHTVPLIRTERSDRTSWRGLDGRLDIVLLSNPDNRILHTVLVEKNGFIHALQFGRPDADAAGALFGPPTYEPWIQSGSDLPA